MNEAQALLKCMGLLMPIEDYLKIAFEQFQENQDNRFGIEVILKESYNMNEKFINGMFKHWKKQKPTKKLVMIGIRRKGERGFTIKVAK